MTGESDADLGAQFPNHGEIERNLVENAETLAGAGNLSLKPLETYVFCRFVFVRAVALVFLLAFFSLYLQIDGLFAKNGILPIADLMQSVSSAYREPSKFFDFPTLFWISASDSFLKSTCAAGMFFSVMAMTGIICGPSLLICWLLYLSFLTAGADFMSFQWDILLLEAGILAAFWAPWAMASPPLRAKIGDDGPPSRIVLWLLRWLLFRLMFMSGMCKLMSGDDTWWGLTALAYHYETQPLPTPLAWVCNSFPLWFQQLSCLIMFAIEIGSPFLIFGNAFTRRIAFGALAGLQILILLSGNYTFFNLLSIILCFTLIDDSLWQRIFPVSLRTALESAAQSTGSAWQKCQKIMVLPLVSILCFANACMLSLHVAGGESLPLPLREFIGCVHQFRLVNGYGLFAVMTRKRVEIILAGSNDGKEWRPYEFAFKPGDLKRPPPVVAPLQPRLDWQMWFAALGRFEDNAWFASFVQRLLEGDKEVIALLANNPFPDQPPKYLRAQSYEYHFTDAKELFSTGNWWKRTYTGEYMPVATLRKQQ
ncbi:MAG: membrane protein [Cyanobacteria bacterium DS2.3.42]|nr:membrane protein [Cyanobacteria bacterium DS2.3.42]